MIQVYFERKTTQGPLGFYYLLAFSSLVASALLRRSGNLESNRTKKAKFRNDSAIRNLKCTGQNKLSVSTTSFGGVNSTSTILLMN
ncbi:hypothetical protein GAYE_SCF04G2395 [Galdieria yellowstonensis]|uniref:Uncharacterized protein n=1 Tax=Galdieria yellowstonensis TaxID=3028027 RepID=A0AAV9IB64_9RHOD|nr:hypothetical protein GAYE_SCF04G2395 [Galdieria yellowstonensis]